MSTYPENFIRLDQTLKNLIFGGRGRSGEPLPRDAPNFKRQLENIDIYD